MYVCMYVYIYIYIYIIITGKERKLQLKPEPSEEVPELPVYAAASASVESYVLFYSYLFL